MGKNYTVGEEPLQELLSHPTDRTHTHTHTHTPALLPQAALDGDVEALRLRIEIFQFESFICIKTRGCLLPLRCSGVMVEEGGGQCHEAECCLSHGPLSLLSMSSERELNLD